ncbi:uncharacterized protein DS421_14g475730 [Arachis hypogaea]|nr:uncharacterized protein DS421_14g475730 [Arachis hypogaea]
MAAAPLAAENSSATSGTTAKASGYCCRRRKRLPLIHQSFWPPPELLSGRFKIAAASC